MCTVSMVGDFYTDKWKDLTPSNPIPNPYINTPVTTTGNTMDFWKTPWATKQEYDALKKEVEDMKELLKRAIEYDKKNNEPHCEIEEKIATLKKIAEWVGVDLTDVLK